jgi:6-phosphogluconate dehydrogenase
MVPHGVPTDSTIDALLDLLAPGDTIVDGGNSRYLDSMRAAERAAARGIDFLDAGVSGGVWGLEEGYCLMVGGSAEAFARLEPAFRTLAPENGYAHVGSSGAGHFVKMIHNAIEYGFLEALGEGFECMEKSGFDIDLSRVADLWQHGSVVRSWLLELLSRAFHANGNELDGIRGYVDDSGMGRWSVNYAVDNAVPTPVLTQALYARFQSRLDDRFADRVIAALRNQFGGHAIHEAT